MLLDETIPSRFLEEEGGPRAYRLLFLSIAHSPATRQHLIVFYQKRHEKN